MRLRYRLVRRLFLLLARPMFDLRVHGAERLPRSGPAILVASHRSWLDPALLGAASPRPVQFLILDRVYHWPWAGWFFRWMCTIPVGSTPGDGLRATRAALGRLREGGVIGIFPEGRVFPEEQPGVWRQGVALLALRSGAPVVPVGIRGSARAWPRGRWPRVAPVRVHVGRPLVLEAGRRGREAVEHTVERIRDELAELERE